MFTRILKWNESEHPREQQGSLRGQFIAADNAVSGRVERRVGGKTSVPVTTVGSGRVSIETTREGRTWIETHRRGLQKQHEGLPGGKTNPIHCGADLEQAQRLIGQGLHITLDQPDQVSTLVNKIYAEVVKAEAEQRKLPIFNIAGISVKGTNLFAQDNLDIDRVHMPQVSGVPLPGSKADALPKNVKGGVDLTNQFLESLAKEGVGAKEEDQFASHLRATQDGIDGAKVAVIARIMRDGEMEEGIVTTTREGYVLDGHHRWAATIINDLMDNHPGDLILRVKVLDIDIGTALSKARAFQEEWGIPVAKLGKKREFAVGQTALTFKREIKKKKRKRIEGMQEVPMDLDAIDASLRNANS